MSLYNKYRPKSLSEVKGNSDLVATLDKMLSGKEIPHAFLLHGETGTGKPLAYHCRSSWLCERT